MIKPYLVFDIETTGLNPWYDNRITCICAKSVNYNVVKDFKLSGDNEKVLLEQFLYFLRDYKDSILVTANGKDFDIPFILTRCVLNGITFFECEFLLRLKHFDLQQQTNKKISLNDLSIILLDKKKEANCMTAIILATEKRFDELIKYCMNDVQLTEECYLKLLEIRK